MKRRPELVPIVEIVEMLAAIDDAAVLDREGDAAAGVELLAEVLRWMRTPAPSSPSSAPCTFALDQCLKLPHQSTCRVLHEATRVMAPMRRRFRRFDAVAPVLCAGVTFCKGLEVLDARWR